MNSLTKLIKAWIPRYNMQIFQRRMFCMYELEYNNDNDYKLFYPILIWNHLLYVYLNYIRIDLFNKFSLDFGTSIDPKKHRVFVFCSICLHLNIDSICKMHE